MSTKVNLRAHQLTHVLAQREIAKQKPTWKKSKAYWNEKVTRARHDLAVAWSEENLPGKPLEQHPLPEVFNEDFVDPS